eukprot:SAG22_NODE_436_length_10519_cov_21.912188_8_plen_320_part_00
MKPTAVFEHGFEGKHNQVGTKALPFCGASTAVLSKTLPFRAACLSRQWPRLAACYRSVQQWAKSGRGGFWPGYEWLVRSRPDNVFFAPVPTPYAAGGLAADAVHARVRRFGGYENVGDETMSWWRYDAKKDDVCGRQERGLPCRWRDTKKPAAGAQCVLADDQFGYIPVRSSQHVSRSIFAATPLYCVVLFSAFSGGSTSFTFSGLALQAHSQLAQAYFAVAGPPPVGGRRAALFTHTPMVAEHAQCLWPEGKLTCRLLEVAGAWPSILVRPRLHLFVGRCLRFWTPRELKLSRGPLVPGPVRSTAQAAGSSRSPSPSG